ncbi:MAG: Rne/Rng family ribonuclease [Bacteroidales bacterium]|nr:Rne/Rng family ribonuclease [Bacteroidales bacterium]NCU36966.1 Rne/Rng family ribonuclease [Candidatus Falkowbacteria bacterium]MDD2632686.1 Rne/Rng family ribonuclease [Bacteroidales bacterium]MDD3527326.1 Rne/Rng family ribonuclease [Bacteroidales bacterium]MDD4176680.1 Rne/Rng family ribonuclease [Bacteroidales bacterium]
MDRDLIINSNSSGVDIALLEDKYLVELTKEKSNKKYSVGDVYLGKVKKLMPGLNAAFVNVGYEKDAFLHYLDLGPQVRSLIKFTKLASAGKIPNVPLSEFRLEPDIEKTGKISDVFSVNQPILVQIAKEPISTKGPRISSEISFAGRYLVLVPLADRISVSQKIRSLEERKRLKRLIKSIKPNNFGVIVRTAAENKLVADLDADLKDLLGKWDIIATKLNKAEPPTKIVSELDRTSAILRDHLNESFNNIHVDDASLADEVRIFIKQIAPEKAGIVKHYSGAKPIFEHFGVDKQIKNSFGKIVTIKSGVYLIIEQTEAMHTIDVNSGHRVNKDKNQESNSLEVNLEAATEIARQMRLRDIGGIIVVDFIDMTQAKHRRQLYQHIKDEMAKDKAKHSILPPSKFGLVQITRQRVRPAMNVQILEKCPVCNGTGENKAAILIIDEIENNLQYLLQEQNEKNLTITVHPFVHAQLTIGFPSLRMKWMWRYKQRIHIKPSASHHFLEYHFFNSKNDELKM